MKKILSFIFLGAALLTIAACSDETETKVSYPPEITLSPSSVTLSSEATTYTIDYIVSNPVDGATVGLSADASWVSGFDTSASGQATFSVSQNSADELRTASLTVSYSYNDGTSTAKAAIVQYGINDPILSVDPEAVLASSEGGEYSFGYSIENPIEGESVNCSTSATWVSGFTDADGTVSFTVAANDEDGLRTATIIVSYYGLEKEVDVVQEHEGGADGITITVDPNTFVVDTEGGEFNFTYTVDGALDPTVTCATEDDWITDITDNDGTVSFTVAAMTSHDLRTGFITVTCGSHSKEVEIVQDRLNDPTLSIATAAVTAEGKGGTYSFNYVLKNPYVGEELKVEADVNWISDFVDDGEGTVTFSVSQSDQVEKRYGTITATYMEDLVATLSVSQRRKPDSDNWTQYGTGDYSYSNLYYFNEYTTSTGLAIYQNGDDKTRFKIEGWGDNKTDFLFTYDEDANVITVDEQYTGEDYGSYGEVDVTDLMAMYPEVEENGGPAGFYEDGVFHFAVYYYCSGGYFGFGYEVFTLDTATSSHPTLDDIVGTYSISGWSGYDGEFYTGTYVLEESDDSKSGNIMFTTIDGVTCGTTSSGGGSSGGGGGGGGFGGGGSSSVTTSYVYGTYDVDTGIAEFECDQIYGSISSGNGPFQTTYYLGFSLYSYYDTYPVTFRFFNNGAIWGPFYGDMVTEDEYTYSSGGMGSSAGFSYYGLYEAYMYMYGAQPTSSEPEPDSLRSHSASTVNKLSKSAHLSGGPAANRLKK